VLKPAEQVGLWNITGLGEQQHQRLLLPRLQEADQLGYEPALDDRQ
jgi:hypothetical protein